MAEIDWGLLRSPDMAAGALGAFQAGAALGRQKRVNEALARYPTDPSGTVDGLIQAGAVDQASALDAMQRGRQTRAVLSRVYGGAGAGQAAGGILSGQSAGGILSGQGGGPAMPGGASVSNPPPGTPSRRTLGDWMRQNGPMGQPGAADPAGPVTVSGGMIDTPASQTVEAEPAPLPNAYGLPPRTDGIALNRDALHELYAIDPQTAHQVEQWAYDADEKTFGMAQKRAALMGNVAFRLSKLPPDQRAGELKNFAPQLGQFGLSPQQIAAADLSDGGLQRQMSIATNLNSLVDNDRQDRRLDWDIQDDQADNARADRNTNDVIGDRAARRGLTVRGQDIASGDRRRGQDLTSGDRRRDQDMTDTRYRDGLQGGGRGRYGVRPGGGPPRVPGTAENPAVVTTVDQAKLLPAGTFFKGPDGVVRQRH